jgi:hypothetical protein
VVVTFWDVDFDSRVAGKRRSVNPGVGGRFSPSRRYFGSYRLGRRVLFNAPVLARNVCVRYGRDGLGGSRSAGGGCAT